MPAKAGNVNTGRQILDEVSCQIVKFNLKDNSWLEKVLPTKLQLLFV